MRLAELRTVVAALDLTGDGEVDVTSVTHRSDAVAPGALFCCVVGSRADGHDFAPDAAERGAAALLVERAVAVDLPQLRVGDVRAAMGPAAAAVHGDPSRQLAVVGVTGTNGKTTTTHLLQAVLEAHGWTTGVIGTLTGVRTTPEGPELQSQFAGLVEGGARAVAMEVSSHALAQHRVDGTWFAVAVFTNLSHDHLEYHGSMEAYFQAKARLFEPGRAAVAVVNVDDPHGRLLLDAAEIPTRPYSLADAEDLRLGPDGSRFSWRGHDVTLRLGGRFNVSNALAAAAAASELGVPPGTIAAGLSSAGSVPGRFETVDAGQPFLVVVDYAHTPDGIEQVLDAARELSRGRVVVVFGCGGDRDRAKRPAMGAAAARLADLAVVTSDNPRSEDPAVIIEEVLAGVAPGAAVVVEPDRRAAIAVALEAAGDGDVVVIAGKGHETTQTVGDHVLPFDDRVVAREELERLVGGGAG